MKKLLSILILLGNGALLAMSGGAGCPAGGDSSAPDNVVYIEAGLVNGGKRYDQLIVENLAAKRSLLDNLPKASSEPKSGSGAGAEESKGTLDPKVLKVYTDAGIDLEEALELEAVVQKEYEEKVWTAYGLPGIRRDKIRESKSIVLKELEDIVDSFVELDLSGYKGTGLTEEEAAQVESIVQKEYSKLNALEKRLTNLEGYRKQQIKAFNDKKDVLREQEMAAAVSAALARFKPAEEESALTESSAAELEAIFDFTVFRNLHAGFAETSSSREILNKFKEYRGKAFGRIGTQGARDNVTALFNNELARYMNNIAVVDFLYLNFALEDVERMRFSLLSRYRPATYEDVVDTSLDVKVAKLRMFFGVKDAS